MMEVDAGTQQYDAPDPEFGGQNPASALTYFSGTAGKAAQRITMAAKATRQRSGAAIRTPPLSPDQSTPSGKTLAFIPSSDKNVFGYSIYRSMTNNPQTGQRINFIPQPPDQQSVSVGDNPQVVGTYYYWVAALNQSGAESARIGLGQLIKGPPSGSSVPYTVVFSTTPIFNLANGNTQIITLTGNVTSSSISGSHVLGDTLLLYIFQDSTGGWAFVWPPNIIGGIQPPQVGQGPGQMTKAYLQWDGTGWELVNNVSIL